MKYHLLVWVSIVVAVFRDEAYQIDWHIPLIGEPKAAVAVLADSENEGSSLVLLTNKSIMARISRLGNVLWRKEVPAKCIASDSNEIIVTGGEKIDVWNATGGSPLWSKDKHATTVCVNQNTVVAADRQSVEVYLQKEPVLLYSHKLPEQVKSVFCSPQDVYVYTQSSIYKLDKDKYSKVDDAPKLRGKLELEDGFIETHNGIVSYFDYKQSTPIWTRDESLSSLIDAIFLRPVPSLNTAQYARPSVGSFIDAWKNRIKLHIKKVGLGHLQQFRVKVPKQQSSGRLLVVLTSHGSIVAFNTNGVGLIAWQRRDLHALSISQVGTCLSVKTVTGHIWLDDAGRQVTQCPTDKKYATPPTFDYQYDANHIVGLYKGKASWTFKPRGRILAVSRSQSDDGSMTLAQGSCDIMYKYLNPNTIAVASYRNLSKQLTISVLDGITGRILLNAVHDNPVSVNKNFPLRLGFDNSWIVYTYLSDDGSYLPQMTVIDLLETDKLNTRISRTGNISVFEDFLIPVGINSTFVLNEPIEALAISRTKYNIAQQQVLLSTKSGKIISIPRKVASARRIVPQMKTAAHNSALRVSDDNILSHHRRVLGVRNILTEPTERESTYILAAFGGLDIFVTQVAPSGEFDYLSQQFPKTKLTLFLSFLVVIALILRKLSKDKKLKKEWQRFG